MSKPTYILSFQFEEHGPMSQSRPYTSEGYENAYEVVAPIGQGSFGVVLKAKLVEVILDKFLDFSLSDIRLLKDYLASYNSPRTQNIQKSI